MISYPNYQKKNKNNKQNESKVTNSDRKESSTFSLQDSFLSTKKLIDILTDAVTAAEAYPSIPCGIKENKYYIVENTANREKIKKGMRQQFVDDCGVWTKSNYYTSYYLTETLVNNQYCWKRKNGFKPLIPQPKISEVYVLVRYNSKNKKNTIIKEELVGSRVIKKINQLLLRNTLETFPATYRMEILQSMTMISGHQQKFLT